LEISPGWIGVTHPGGRKPEEAGQTFGEEGKEFKRVEIDSI